MTYQVLGASQVRANNVFSVPPAVHEGISLLTEHPLTFWHVDQESGIIVLADETLSTDEFSFIDNSKFYEKKSEERDIRPPAQLTEHYEFELTEGDYVFFLADTDDEQQRVYLLVDHQFEQIVDAIVLLYQQLVDESEETGTSDIVKAAVKEEVDDDALAEADFYDAMDADIQGSLEVASQELVDTGSLAESVKAQAGGVSMQSVVDDAVAAVDVGGTDVDEGTVDRLLDQNLPT